MKKSFDFIGLNNEIIKEACEGNVRIAAQDASFISKSGTETYGVDFFWKGTAGRAEKGLEIDVIAIINIDNNNKKEGYTLSANQTPANPIPKKERKKNESDYKSRIDLYVEHVKTASDKLNELGVQYITIDAFGAKEKYVTGVTSLGFNVISKLRKDARLKRIYNGPQKSRGRKRQFDFCRIGSDDFNNSIVTKVENENIELTSCIGYSVSLKRQIKIVRVRKLIKNKYCDSFLFSTNLKQDMLQIYQFYVARFQIEFIFRDAKNFTGLMDCQSRDQKRLNYHFNASLTALNVIKAQDAQLQKTKLTSTPFSMANWTRKYHVEIVINRFISMFDLDPTLIKLDPKYNKLLEFGSVKH